LKGTSFQKPLEFRIQVDGESWTQGSVIEGTLEAHNHDTAPIGPEKFRLFVAHGDLKKVKAARVGGFDALVPIDLSPEQGTGNGIRSRWKLQLEPNTPITDKSGSLFLLYGATEDPISLGHLQLMIEPRQIYQDYVDILKTDFRFSERYKKSKKEKVEVKMMPPEGGSAYATVEQLLVYFSLDGDRLHVQYQFSVKEIDAMESGVEIKKRKKTFEQTFGPSEYLLSNGRLKFDHIQAAIQKILEQVARTNF